MKLEEVFDYRNPMLTPVQVQSLRDIFINRKGIDMADGTEEVLYNIFMSLGEMPYGVAKARTGDPSEWIYERLAKMSPGELEDFLDRYTA